MYHSLLFYPTLLVFLSHFLTRYHSFTFFQRCFEKVILHIHRCWQIFSGWGFFSQRIECSYGIVVGLFIPFIPFLWGWIPFKSWYTQENTKDMILNINCMCTMFLCCCSGWMWTNNLWKHHNSVCFQYIQLRSLS